MQFISNMLGGGQAQTPAQDSVSANQISLLGGSDAVLLSDGTAKVGGTPTTVGQGFTAENKIVMFYFSMHNCPPCREFTPLLVELYNDTNENRKQLECVFLSGDQDQNLYNEYFGEMPWLALPFKDERMKPAAKHFGVRGLPRLVVLNAKTGATLHADAVTIVAEQGPVVIEQWLSEV